jgi:Tol biopolymer transport system component
VTAVRALVLAIGALLAAAPGADAAFPGANGRIAMSGPVGECRFNRIITIEPDGGDRRVLTECRRMHSDGTSTGTHTREVDFSPDGRRLLFAFAEDPIGGIAVMDADGSNRRDVLLAPPLSQPGGDEFLSAPAFATGGERFVYTHEGRDPTSGEFVKRIRHARLDGSPVPGGEIDAQFARLSPDGRRLAHVTEGRGTWLARASGGEPIRRLSRRDAYSLDWAPGGRRLVLTRPTASGSDVFVVRADGEATRRLTHTDAREDEAVWSPNGRRIAFVRWVFGEDAVGCECSDGRQQVWTMSRHGRRARLVREGPASVELDALRLSWQPR